MKLLLSLLLSAILVSSVAVAQTGESEIVTENSSIKGIVLARSGQFKIATPNNDPLTYYGQNQWTSHTNFYMVANGTEVVYTNDIKKETDPTWVGWARLQLPDTSYKFGDTVFTVWNNLRAFKFIQRIYPIKTASAGQIMIDYYAEKIDQNSTNVLNGILLMLDLNVLNPDGNDPCGTGGDKPVVLSQFHYDAKINGAGGAAGDCWDGEDHMYDNRSSTGMPGYYLIGRRFKNFGNTRTIGLGKLIGPGLVPPDLFAVGAWNQGPKGIGFKDIAWGITNDTIDNLYEYRDAAVLFRWNASSIVNGTSYHAATCYGLNDFSNYASICPMDLFGMITYAMSEIGRHRNNRFDSSSFLLTMTVANADHSGSAGRPAQNTRVTIDLSNAPELKLAAGETAQKPAKLPPQYTSNFIGPRSAGVCSWRIEIDTSKTRVDRDYFENIGFAVDVLNIPELGYPASRCSTTVTLKASTDPPDVLQPEITQTANTRTSVAWRVADHRAADSGIDSIGFVTALNYSYTVSIFRRCDTSQTSTVTAQVIDTTKPASITVRARDCFGNQSTATASFAPGGSVVAEPGGAPAVSYLAQNYPNPFGDRTLFSFGVAPEQVGKIGVSLDLFDPIGKRVATIFNGELGAGRYVQEFDASALRAGTYFAVLKAGSTMERRIVQLAK